MQAFFQNFSKNFFGPAGGPKSTARTRHRQRPLSPHRKRGLPIFLSQKVSRRQACARTRHRQRPLSPTPNAGRSPFSRRKFRVVRPGPEPGIGSALFPHTANAGRSPFSRRKFRTPKARGADRLGRRRKKTAARLGDCFLCWRTPIFPGRHQPSIFGTNELNFRVRDGNGWTLVVINTNYSFVSGSPDSFYILPRLCANCKHFLRDFFKIPKNHKIWELLSPSSTAFCGKNLTSRRCPPAAWPPSPFAVGRGTAFPGPG